MSINGFRLTGQENESKDLELYLNNFWKDAQKLAHLSFDRASADRARKDYYQDHFFRQLAGQ